MRPSPSLPRSLGSGFVYRLYTARLAVGFGGRQEVIEAYWPAFREIGFLRALRSFAARQRRYGY